MESSDTLSVELGSVGPGDDINVFFSESMDHNSFLLRDMEAAALSFRSLTLSSAAKRAILGTILQSTLHNTRNERSWQMFVGAFNSRIASVINEANSRLLGPIACPR